MNKSSARNVSEFCDIRARDAEGRATIVFVPGHEGREYFVFIHRNGALKVRCNEPGPWGNQGCKGSLKHFCYHMLAALEFAAADQGMTLSWCESKEDAERLARIDGKVFHARSLQSDAEVWGVVKSSKKELKPAFDLLAWADELERTVGWYDATLAKSLANHGTSTSQQQDKLAQLMAKFPERKGDLLAIFPEAVLAHGRNVLRGENVREI